MVNGYGPYAYRVTYEDGEHHWEYLGPVDGGDAGSDDGQDDTSKSEDEDVKMMNPVENPAERMEQLLDEKGIDAQVIKREAEDYSDDEAYIIDFADDEQFEEYFEAVDAGEIVYPSQQDKLGIKWREDDEDVATTVVMPPGALYESVLPTDQYESDPSGGSDVVKVEEFDTYSQGQVYVDIDYEHKDVLKSIDEANATWDGGQWSIDPGAIDEVEERMADEGLDVRLSDTAKAWRDAVNN